MFVKKKIDHEHIAASAGSWITYSEFGGERSSDPALDALVADMAASDLEAENARARALATFVEVSSLIWERAQEDAEFVAAANEYEAASRALWCADMDADAAQSRLASRGRPRKGSREEVKALQEAAREAGRRKDIAGERLKKRLESHIPANLAFDGTLRLDRTLKMHLSVILVQADQDARP